MTADTTPLINKSTRRQLQEDGLAELTRGLSDTQKVRLFADWCKQPGSLVHLFNLLVATSRLAAGHYFHRLKLTTSSTSLEIPGRKERFADLQDSCSTFLEHYPRDDFVAAWSQQPGQIRQRLVGEMFLLKSLVDNPATGTLRRLFADDELCRELDYAALVHAIDSFCNSDHKSETDKGLIALLMEPVAASPDSLPGQLVYIQKHWSAWLPDKLLQEIDIARAVYTEETRPRLPGPGPSPFPVIGRDDGSDLPAAFTADTDWMSNAVLLAKSIYVWLDQLSARYQRLIATLADIPDDALATLSRQGFNALWLIGIWERSKASRKIKQICGNPEAEASAYSLHAYRVAEDLGGEAALAALEARCNRYGIRLACDVVPNHTGIDSEWGQEHPDWFIQSDHPPYPSYRFSGPDLCETDGLSIRIEDGYWDHSDAAVVCEYHEHHSGRRRYIYHGNDGTHMPWNDTAQLNFLLPDVRRAMSDLIVAVAKRFRLIRFDAAMTLARKHFRRLWFPPPGGSAGVPSRSEAWLSDEDFNQAFPVEFWREVVDRVNREAPDTLLIAEAFWMMESYFVRNLGMHRVYNSAFMNMLKREENARYRTILKDTLAYNPEILKRYVNFMNNPDEATAVEQFGKGDKYFGVATLLATLPGLPMFGHGQVEGYREKYGMEYRKAYWDEQPDEGFIAHHERQIFPLLQRRDHFAGVDDFSFFDFTTAGGVDENVYAFSNGPQEHKVLVIYNNSPQATSGRVHKAAPGAVPGKEGTPKQMPPLWLELNLEKDGARFCRYRELRGNDYLVPLDELKTGMAFDLEGYEHLVCSDFHLLADEDGIWQQIHDRLRGAAVASLDRLRQEHVYGDIWQAARVLLDPDRLEDLAVALSASPARSRVKTLVSRLSTDFAALFAALQSTTGAVKGGASAPDIATELELIPDWLARLSQAGTPQTLLADLWKGHRNVPGLGSVVVAWLLLRLLARKTELTDNREFGEHLRDIGLDYAWQQMASGRAQQKLINTSLLLLDAYPLEAALTDDTFIDLCRDPANRDLLDINRHNDITWFGREGMTILAGSLALCAALESELEGQKAEITGRIAEQTRGRLARASAVGYQLDKFLLVG